ncbi:hypothetical protein UFOVP239_53 [uncultured Caudovirales phage]|uniref:Uncharacterized protein n=1 Tax=uncultured Caudovirales phage TaxID=2100421 RepID=A0A6J7WQC2_9CAUD|nr:hypothetical protein UFOVP239_53 [uncultured Caudovirales phage]
MGCCKGFIGKILNPITDEVKSVGRSFDDAIAQPVIHTVENTLEAIEKDPLSAIVKIGTAIVAPELLIAVNFASAIANGQDLCHALGSAVVSTVAGSIGGLPGQVVGSVLTGKDPGQAILGSLVNAGINSGLSEISGSFGPCLESVPFCERLEWDPTADMYVCGGLSCADSGLSGLCIQGDSSNLGVGALPSGCNFDSGSGLSGLCVASDNYVAPCPSTGTCLASDNYVPSCPSTGMCLASDNYMPPCGSTGMCFASDNYVPCEPVSGLCFASDNAPDYSDINGLCDVQPGMDSGSWLSKLPKVKIPTKVGSSPVTGTQRPKTSTGAAGATTGAIGSAGIGNAQGIKMLCQIADPTESILKNMGRGSIPSAAGSMGQLQGLQQIYGQEMAPTTQPVMPKNFTPSPTSFGSQPTIEDSLMGGLGSMGGFASGGSIEKSTIDLLGEGFEKAMEAYKPSGKKGESSKDAEERELASLCMQPSMLYPGTSSSRRNPVTLAQLRHIHDQISPAGNIGGLAQGGLPKKYQDAAPSGHHPEFVTGITGYYASGGGTGQSDDIPAMLHDGDYVMDAEAVSALGDGSSKAGAETLDGFRKQVPHHDHRGGNPVPAKIADGEYVFPAAFVTALGGGDNKMGSKILDGLREQLRQHKRSAPTSKIPPKAKTPLDYIKKAKG